MLESINRVFVELPSFTTMFFIFFGETLAFFLGVLVTMFFCFHIWLMLKAMTTIEFCEKSLKKTGYDSSVYHQRGLGNMRSVLGPHWYPWLLPIQPPTGNGINFVTESSRLTDGRPQTP